MISVVTDNPRTSILLVSLITCNTNDMEAVPTVVLLSLLPGTLTVERL